MMELSKEIARRRFVERLAIHSGPDNPRRGAFGLDFSGFWITFSEFQTGKLTPPLVMS